MYLFISFLYMFRATQCSSSGESVVSIHHLVCITLCRWLPGMPVCRPAYQAVTYTEWYIPDDVLIQLILLMMSTGLLETCREVKEINTLKKCVKLVINKNGCSSIVLVVCCVGSSLCGELITHSGESYWVCLSNCVWYRDLINEATWARVGL